MFLQVQTFAIAGPRRPPPKRILDSRGFFSETFSSWKFGAEGIPLTVMQENQRSNFVTTMLRLGLERDVLRPVYDQIGSPISAAQVAQALYCMIARLAAGANKGLFDTFHYDDWGSTRWGKFVETVFGQAGDWAKIRAQAVPMSSSDYPTPARRRHYCMLDCRKISPIYGIRQEN